MANFSDDKIKAVWEKAQVVEGYDSTKYRKDVCGAWIAWADYGKKTLYGWAIDHCLPLAKGGTDHLDNLRPMHTENNQSKADEFPSYTAVITSERNKNKTISERKTVNNEVLEKLKQLYPNNPYLRNI
jgi:hypothetical protein